MKNLLKNIPYVLGLAVLIFVVAGLSTYLSKDEIVSENMQIASVALFAEPEWHYKFQSDGILEETGILSESSSPFWWVNSGGQLIIKGGVGQTFSGNAREDSKWNRAYKASSPSDTDLGAHPQNIFRLLSKNKWLSASTELRFKITRVHMSESENRNESNGVLLIMRYLDSDNLYYAGLRVDGHAVIKKKRDGIYYTLAEKQIFDSEAPYQKYTNPNLLPGQVWLGMRTDISTNSEGYVQIAVLVDKGGGWQEVLNVVDNGGRHGSIIKDAGLFGIRTDFMDLQFDDFKIFKINS